jgi:hypothetical protein
VPRSLSQIWGAIYVGAIFWSAKGCGCVIRHSMLRHLVLGLVALHAVVLVESFSVQTLQRGAGHKMPCHSTQPSSLTLVPRFQVCFDFRILFPSLYVLLAKTKQSLAQYRLFESVPSVPSVPTQMQRNRKVLSSSPGSRRLVRSRCSPATIALRSNLTIELLQASCADVAASAFAATVALKPAFEMATATAAAAGASASAGPAAAAAAAAATKPATAAALAAQTAMAAAASHGPHDRQQFESKPPQQCRTGWWQLGVNSVW